MATRLVHTHRAARRLQESCGVLESFSALNELVNLGLFVQWTVHEALEATLPNSN